MQSKHLAGQFHLKAADGTPDGSFACIFSTFDRLDKDRDIIRASAFADLDGVAVPVVWAHLWDGLAIGKGTIRVLADHAELHGQFNLATQAGRDAYETVKFMGPLQEYSFGFQLAPGGTRTVQDAGDGLPAREILGIHRVFEVSPVLVGAGEATRTLAIKAPAGDRGATAPRAATGRKSGLNGVPLPGSYEALLADLAEAWHAQTGQWPCLVATFPDQAIVAVYPRDADGYAVASDPTYYRVPYTLDDAGAPVLGAPEEVAPTFVPVADATAPAVAAKTDAAADPADAAAAPAAAPAALGWERELLSFAQWEAHEALRGA